MQYWDASELQLQVSYLIVWIYNNYEHGRTKYKVIRVTEPRSLSLRVLSTHTNEYEGDILELQCFKLCSSELHNGDMGR